MSLVSTLCPAVERIILSSPDGIGIGEISAQVKAKRGTVQKIIRALTDSGAPIDKTFRSGSLALWCPAERIETVRARQQQEQAARQRIWSERGRENRRIRKTGSAEPATRPALKGEVTRQTVVKAEDVAPPVSTAPRSVFEWGR